MKRLIMIICAAAFTYAAAAQERLQDRYQDRMRDPATPAAELLKTLKHKYAPDVRTTVFTVTLRESGDTCVLRGDVASEALKKNLLDAFGAKHLRVIDSISVLPSKEIGAKTYGIITVSVANMRVEPKESAEMGSQTLMGGIVRVFKKKGLWYLIQSPDAYLGWADGEQFLHCTKSEADAWDHAEKVFVTVPFDFVKETTAVGAPSVCDVVGGAILQKLGVSGEWLQVRLADGRTGYIHQASVVDLRQWGTSIVPTAEKLEATAKQFLGIPYLWGGTSVKGMDCSGFTRTVYLLNGMLLKRDASQQAEDGVLIDPGPNWENLRKGDLLFFGVKASGDRPDRISHVAMYLENRMFIHSSGKIRISSVDPASPLYDDYHVKNFVCAKRMLH
jgi:gamma-D-glutamyl-L-lysine dipeptidyl-peptidase